MDVSEARQAINSILDDITSAAQPRSDQINADDLISGPRVVRIVEVRKGSAEQPVEIVTEEFGPGRPYKPAKSMLRVLIAAWGSKASAYAGRRLVLYRDPEISFGPAKVGGIRISAMSDIPQRLTIALTVTRGRRTPFTVEPLPDTPPAPAPITDDDAVDFARAIAEAASMQALNKVGADLKAVNLGSHADKLRAAWSERKAEIEGGAE